MKRRIPFIGAYLILLLVVMVSVVLCSSCKGNRHLLPFGQSTEKTVKNDSILFAEYVDHIINPEFTSTSQILQYRKCKNENARIDSIFMSMDDETIRNVASVCLKRGPSIKRKDLVTEYTKNIDIYTALPRNIDIAEKKDTVLEGPRVTRVEIPKETTLSVNLRDTIIEGKKYRIETKLVEYNE